MIFDEKQLALQQSARRFARERLLPAYIDRDRRAGFDRSLLREMGEFGFLTSDSVPGLSGRRATAVDIGIIVEELAYGDFNLAGLAVVQSLCGAVIGHNASPRVRDAWLHKVFQGQALLSIAVTEKHAGSDAGGISTRARRDGDEYVLSGEKWSINFADTADAFVVFARIGEPGGDAVGITAFLVPASSIGLDTERYDNVSSRLGGRGTLHLNEVRIPVDFRLGEEGGGFTQVMKGFDFSRALIALQCIGAARASLDETWAYTVEREAFGGPIARFQGVTFPLVDAEAQLAAGRQLAYHALALRDVGQAHTEEAALVKSFVPRAAHDAIHDCLLTFGHYGCTMDSPHQQRMRDVMGLELGDGTAGILKMVVARKRAGRIAGSR